MTSHAQPVQPSTAVVSLGRPPRETGSPLNPSITMTSTFVSAEPVRPGENVYARFSNPTWEPFEAAVAELEGARPPALAYASGMAAVSAVFSLLPLGGAVVVPTTSYNGTIGLARKLHAEGSIELREIDAARLAAGDLEEAAVAFEGAALVWLESPTNPLLEVLDLPRTIAAAKQAGALVAVDNTFSTPLRQRSLEFGADLVVHSGTKFIAGHSDVLMGLVVVRDASLRDRLLLDRTLRGGVPGPFEAWLALRGLRTLAIRLDRAEQNAFELARRLETRPEVSRVRYPGLPGDPGHALAKAQLSGFGALVSIEFEAGAEHADRFVGGLRLLTPATSLGGVETLAERRRRHPGEPAEVPDSLVRLAIGIEHVEDLWADIVQALEA